MLCFIPAAGFGKRMGALTENNPKPLLKIGNETFLERTINMAKGWGIKNFVINTHYQAEKIHYEINKYQDVRITISHEKEKILGTAGGMKTALQSILEGDDCFLTINPDIIYYTKSNITEILRDYNGKCLLFLYKSKETKYTKLKFKNGKIYFENGDYIYTGIAYLKYSILNSIPTNQYYDLVDIFRELSVKNELDGLEFPGEYVDLGDEKSYLEFISSIDIRNQIS